MILLTPKPHIAQLLDHAAAKDAGIFAYAQGESEEPLYLSYSQLRLLATQKADLLRNPGSQSSAKIVLIHFATQFENIVWFWASILAGMVPCLSRTLEHSPEERTANFEHLHRLLLDPLVITSQTLQDRDFATNSVLRIVAVEKLEAGMPAPERHTDEPLPSTEGVATMMLTSGSTGRAKAVPLTHRQIFAAVSGKLAMLPLPEKSSLLNWIAVDHVASLVEIHLCGLAAGLDQIHVPATEVITDPLLFLRLIAKHGVSRTFAPNFFLQKLSTTLDAAAGSLTDEINLSQLQYIGSGGEPNVVDVCVRLTKQLTRLGTHTSPIVPGFGMTETCAGAIYNLSSPQTDISAGSKFASLGACMPGIEMRIGSVTGDDVEVDNKATGWLEIRGEVVFEGYFNDEIATRAAFTADGWFRTGDLASLDRHGRLHLAGRWNDVININGIKHDPSTVEAALNQAAIAGIAPFSVACFSYRPPNAESGGIMVVYEHAYPMADSEARMSTLRSISRIVSPIVGSRPHVLPLTPGQLVKTTLGKLSRVKICRALEQGQFHDDQRANNEFIRTYRSVECSPPQNETEEALMGLLHELFVNQPEMEIDHAILNMGISSVDLIRLKRAIERIFRIAEIPMVMLLTHTTIESLSSAIRALRQNSCKASCETYQPVVTLQPQGSKVPLWLFHPGIGEVLVFLGLVQYFPDRPIYAMRARGFNRGEEPFAQLSDMLSTYYRAMKAQQPEGPYALAGYSYGSMIAFEVSKMLEANGDQVRFLGCFNLPPHIQDRMRTLDWTAGVLHIAHFCGVLTEQQAEAMADDLRALTPAEQVSRVLAEGSIERCKELALTQESLLTWTNVAWSLQKIGWEYSPTGSVTTMDVFYCQPLKLVARSREEYRNTKLNHWVDFVREDIRYHEVDGEHYTMIGPEHVVRFQLALKQALAARGL
ncbi:putative polyketide synthase PksJ [Aspergillus indologenus CBS 114.80]|uniref:Putative polyketide synthase PksJ n=1 Tax=Aspergillus indologenus CBS 114.80 TaxID=1450541 RepID=A0A2V5HZ13_9EURO|nr:putative polyketide synthase PksJ [Aspergillus indologenus CBS 114.80]